MRSIYRRTLLGGAFVVLCMAANASAEELVSLGLVEIDMSEPGVLVIDASDHKAILPLYDGVREFESVEAYHDFLRAAINAQDGLSSTIVILGQAFSYDVDLQNFIPVSDPLATLVGGRWGVVRVAGVDYCIDPDRCGDNRVNMFSLGPVDMELVGTFLGSDTGGDLADASLAAIELQGGFVEPFLVEAKIVHRESVSVGYGPGDRLHIVDTDFRVRQISGGYKVLVPVQVVTGFRDCGTHLVGDFIQPFGGCYLVPQATVQTFARGQNHLSAHLNDFVYWSKNWVCTDFIYPYRRSKSLPNTEMVNVRWVRDYFEWEIFYAPQTEAAFRPHEIRAYFAGWDVANPSILLRPKQEGYVKFRIPGRPPRGC